MNVIVSFVGCKGHSHEDIREKLDQWSEQHLSPLLSHQGSDSKLVASIKQHSKGNARYSVNLRVHLPRKRVVTAHGENVEFQPALAQAEERLLGQVKRHMERLHHQDDYRRKARRQRLHDMKARAAAASLAASAERSHATLESVLPRLRQSVRRELAYLYYNGNLFGNYPAVNDIVDEAVMALTAAQANEADQQTADSLLQNLLREAFKIIDREVAISRRYGELLSLDAEPAEDAMEQAESMVEDEMYEFYQPDETVHIADLLPDDMMPDPESLLAADEEALEQAAVQREFSLETLAGLPVIWRRVFVLSRSDGFAVTEIAAIMDKEVAAVEAWLEGAEEFLREHLHQVGLLHD